MIGVLMILLIIAMDVLIFKLGTMVAAFYFIPGVLIMVAAYCNVEEFRDKVNETATRRGPFHFLIVVLSFISIWPMVAIQITMQRSER